MDPFDGGIKILVYLVFPKPKNHPALSPKFLKIPSIPRTVRCDLRFPLNGELVPPSLEVPTMPEIAVHKNDDHGATEHEVRAAGQISCVGLPFNAGFLKRASHHSLRQGTFPFDL